MLVGHIVSGRVHDYFAYPEGGHAWAKIFMVPIVITVIAAIVFICVVQRTEISSWMRRQWNKTLRTPNKEVSCQLRKHSPFHPTGGDLAISTIQDWRITVSDDGYRF